MSENTNVPVEQAAVSLPETIHIDEQLTAHRITSQDAKRWQAFVTANRQFLAEQLPVPEDYTVEQAQEDLQEVDQAYERGEAVDYFIDELGRDTPVATATIYSIEGSYARLGYMLAEDAQKRGIATRSAIALRDQAFENLGIRTLEMRIEPHNEASRRIAVRLGAILEPDLITVTKPEGQVQMEVWRVTKHD